MTPAQYRRYHSDLNAFYTVSKRSIKVWDSRAKLSKVAPPARQVWFDMCQVLRDVARNEITAVCFANKGRKLYCGDSRGEVRREGRFGTAFFMLECLF